MTPLKINDDFQSKLNKSITRLLNYCKKNNWSGFDPYDGLNSRVFSALPLVQNRIGRLIFIQGMKRLPINLRRFLLVPKGENPKACALFCSSLVRLSNIGILKDESLITARLNRLVDIRSKDHPYYCWGYNFDWQSKGFFLPKFSPNIICTTFAGNALIDAYHKFADEKYLDMAISAGNFLLKGLNITKNKDELCFSYTTLDSSKVHNANLLGAAFLARLYSITGEKKFIDFASSAVQFSIRRQNEDGSWPYGEHRTQQWVDNFHTGYNLIALKKFSQYTENERFMDNIQKGFRFYLNNFFTPKGVPKYYHNKLYPIDIHSIAQSIITLTDMSDFDESAMDVAIRVYTWAIKNMQSKNGYFFYQKKRFFKNRIPYMRWSQAWMLYALSIIHEHL